MWDNNPNQHRMTAKRLNKRENKMFNHGEIWIAIDRLANVMGYSTSGLAKKAGLDPTAFNKSKRMSPEGKPRWPSTESLSKNFICYRHYNERIYNIN